MANDLNQCTFTGRLGADPELRYTPARVAIANFTMAVGETWKNKSTGDKKEKTEWLRVVAFGKLAEIMAEFLNKGSFILIVGKMQTRNWEDKEGNKRYTTEIVANQMQMLGSKGGSQHNSPETPRRENMPDIPF